MRYEVAPFQWCMSLGRVVVVMETRTWRWFGMMTRLWTK